MSDERKKIIERVSKLLNMTTDKGASEQEAVVAAEKATALMTEYNINMTEIGLKNSKSVAQSAESTIFHNNWKLGDHEIARPIARLCDCIYWHQSKTNNFIFYGLPTDAEYAMFLYEMLSNCIWVGLEAYKESEKFRILAEENNKITLYRAFIRGMQLRLAERLYEMALEKEHTVKAATGNALVVLKREVVEKDLKETGIEIYDKKRTQRAIKSSDAYSEGQKAGDRVNITTGLNKDNKTQIGG